MEKKINAVTGTQDLIAQDLAKLQQVSNCFTKSMRRLNIQSVQTPILEKVEVFEKNLGETSDIVQKEMFTLKAQGETLVLRPEGTAGVIRALISSGWVEKLPLKVAYDGPMFRKETPQKGRFRQFDQLGVEFLGYKSEAGDLQCLFSAITFLKDLKVLDQVTLELNLLGTDEERANYKTALVEYLTKYKSELSEDSQARLQTNPLRILDSKNENDQRVLKNAPKLSSFYGDQSKKERETLEQGLKDLKVQYKFNTLLVRGLDYYNGLVFEFVSNKLGAQNTVLAGGRYDRLTENMGGPKTACIGWAAGKERLSYLITLEEKISNLVGIVVTSEEYNNLALKISSLILEKTSYAIEIPANESLGKKFKKLNKLKAKFVVVIGDEEVRTGQYSLKNMETGEQTLVDEKNLLLKLLVSSLERP